MMLDRMFFNEEQQSLIMLRQGLEEGPSPEMLQLPPQQHQQLQHSSDVPSCSTDQLPEDYDEWACIQRELGCLPTVTTAEDLKPQPAVSVASHSSSFGVKSTSASSTLQAAVTTVSHSTPVTTSGSTVRDIVVVFNGNIRK